MDQGLTITEEEVRAFVGNPKADYYIGKWSLPNKGFNWAACLLSGLWLPYRKMYVPTVIFFGIMLVDSVIEDIVFVEILRMPEPPPVLDKLVGLIAALVCGLFGNRWYLSHAHNVIAEVRSQGLPEEDHLRMLSKRGGTNLLASLGFLRCLFWQSFQFSWFWIFFLHQPDGSS